MATTTVAAGKRLPERIRAHNTTLVAAGVAFYAFLEFIPALIATVSIYGLIADPSDVKHQVKSIASALPEEVQRFLNFQLTSIVNANRAGVSVTLAISIVIALWSASGGMAAVYLGRTAGMRGFSRLVAIKMLHEQFEHDEEFLA